MIKMLDLKGPQEVLLHHVHHHYQMALLWDPHSTLPPFILDLEDLLVSLEYDHQDMVWLQVCHTYPSSVKEVDRVRYHRIFQENILYILGLFPEDFLEVSVSLIPFQYLR
jgi:hypothetical protein